MSSSVTCGISRVFFDHVTIIVHCIPTATKTGNILAKQLNAASTGEKATDTSNIHIGLPYVRGLSERLHRIFHSQGAAIYHKLYGSCDG